MRVKLFGASQKARTSIVRFFKLLKTPVFIASPALVTSLLLWSPVGRDLIGDLDQMPMFTHYSTFILVSTSIALLFGILLYLIIDYSQHRKPLKVAVPTIRYNLAHHVRVVTLPLVRSKWKVLALSTAKGLLSFALLGIVVVFGGQWLAHAKNFEITIAGSGSSGFMTYTARPSLRGTAPPNSTLTISIDGQQSGTTTTGIRGQWAYQPSNNLTLGNHTITVESHETGKYVYVGNNSGGLSAINTLEHRTTAEISLPAEFVGRWSDEKPLTIASVPTSSKVYAISAPRDQNISLGYISVLDSNTGSIIKNEQISFRPKIVLANPNGNYVVVVGDRPASGNNGQNQVAYAIMEVATNSLELVGVENGSIPNGFYNNYAKYTSDNTSFLLSAGPKLVRVTLTNGQFGLTEDLNSSSVGELVLSTDPDLAYMVNFTEVVGVNLSTMQIETTVLKDTGGGPYGSWMPRLSVDGSKLWLTQCVPDQTSLQFVTIDLNAEQQLSSLQLTNDCTPILELVVNAEESKVYAQITSPANPQGAIQVVDLNSNTLDAPISLGPETGQLDSYLKVSPFNPSTAYYVDARSSDGAAGGALHKLNLTNGTTSIVSDKVVRSFGFAASGDPQLLYEYTEDIYMGSYGYTMRNLSSDVELPLNAVFGKSLNVGAISSPGTALQSNADEKEYSFTVATVNITDPVANAVLTNPTYTVHGTALAGSSVEVLQNDVLKGTVLAGQDNTWSLKLTGLTEGPLNLTARVRADSTGIPILYIDNFFSINGFHLFDVDQGKIEVHDDITFNGKIPIATSPDGNTAITLDFQESQSNPDQYTLYRYDLTTKQESGTVVVPALSESTPGGFFSADGKKLYFTDIDSYNHPGTYVVIDIASMTVDQRVLGGGDVLWKTGKDGRNDLTPDRTKAYIPSATQQKMYEIDTNTGEVTDFPLEALAGYVLGTTNEYVAVAVGSWDGVPSQSRFYESDLQFYSTSTHELLGSIGQVQNQPFSNLFDIPSQHKLNLLTIDGNYYKSSKIIDTNTWTEISSAEIESSFDLNTDTSLGMSGDGTHGFWISNDNNIINRFDTTTGLDLAPKSFPAPVTALLPLTTNRNLYAVVMENGSFTIYNTTTNTYGNIIFGTYTLDTPN